MPNLCVWPVGVWTLIRMPPRARAILSDCEVSEQAGVRFASLSTRERERERERCRLGTGTTGMKMQSNFNQLLNYYKIKPHMVHGSWVILVWLPGVCLDHINFMAHGYLGISGPDIADGRLINLFNQILMHV